MNITFIFLSGLVVAFLLFWLVIIAKYIRAKMFYTKSRKFSPKYLIGKEGEVIVILNYDEGIGQIMVDGKIWSAINYTHEVLKIGAKVEVIAVEGIKLIVKQI